MSQSPMERVLSKLSDAQPAGDGRWKACCPAHEDRNPSLSIAQGDDGRALVHCFAGCATFAIVQAIGLTLADLMPAQDRSGHERQAGGQQPRTPRKPQAAARLGQAYASVEDAIQSIEHRLGPPAGVWTYHDAQGQPVYVAARWDAPAGDKTFRPLVRQSDGQWTVGGQPPVEGWPVYGLPGLLARAGDRIYICEGEKATDAARSIGLLATTSPGGSHAAGKADWSPLAGRDVVILPDNDEAGRRYADDVASLLMKLQPRVTVRIVELPGLPAKGDMVDYLAMQGGDVTTARQAIRKLADEAQPVPVGDWADGPDTTDSLTEPPMGASGAAWQPFPVDALSAVLSSFVREAATAMECDPSFVALPLLAAVASAIGNSRQIQIKRGWTEPAVVWTAIVGESGSMKSPAMELALKPLRDLQDQAMRDHDRAMCDHESSRLEHERQLANWRKSKAGEAPPEAPARPVCRRYYTDDVTMEALACLLKDNPRGLLMARDELAGWFSFDRYAAKGAGGAEVAKWLEVSRANPLMVDRKTSGTIHVPRAAVSVTGGIQPAILTRAIGQQHRENGLLARLLLAMPPRKPRRWTEDEIDPQTQARLECLFTALFQLSPAHGADGEPVPAMVRLTAKAKQRWIAFYQQHNAESIELQGDLAAAWSKLEGYAARLALIHHLARQASPTPGTAPGDAVGDAVDEQSIEAGIRLVRWFANEVRRVYAMMNEDEESRQQRQAIELIQRRGDPRNPQNPQPSVSVRDWQRIRGHRKASDAGAELNELVKKDVGQWEYSAAGKKGGRPSKRFVLHSPPPPEAPPGTSGRTSGGTSGGPG